MIEVDPVYGTHLGYLATSWAYNKTRLNGLKIESMYSFLNIYLNIIVYNNCRMLHQAMLSNTSFDVENSENWLLFVLFSQTEIFVKYDNLIFLRIIFFFYFIDSNKILIHKTNNIRMVTFLR